MAEKTKPQGKMQYGGDGHKSSIAGVIHATGQTQLPQEFITIGKNFEEALGRCVLRDDDQKNAIIIYKMQLEMFDMWKSIENLTNFLNASAAVDGVNRRQALMGYIGIYEPISAGAKTSKETQKVLMEMQKQKAMARGRDNDNERRGDNNGD